MSLLLTIATMVSTFGSAAPASGAAAGPGSAAAINAVPTWTNQTVRVHQCAAMACGYHAVGRDTFVWAHCVTANENLVWSLITTYAPWDANVRIAGFVDHNGLTDIPDVGCDGVGRATGGVNRTTWARSCAGTSCGYGVMVPGTDVAGICYTDSSDDDGRWYLLLDHENGLWDLAGFTPASNYPVNPGFPGPPSEQC